MTAGSAWTTSGEFIPGITIVLKQVEGEIAPPELRIFLSDVYAFHEELKLSSQSFASSVVSWPHGYDCFKVIDPDGHQITFASLH